MNACCYYRSV